MTNVVSGNARPIPAIAGIGLRGPHQARFLHDKPAAGWLEAHSENYFAEDGIAVATLERIRANYPLSLHGVGLSLGSVDPLDTEHLRKLARLVDRIEPGLVSEHLSWGAVDGRHLNDLLPLPYTEEALNHVVARIEQVQNRLGRQILVENVSSYLEFESSTMPEWKFLVEAVERSGAKILLDVNNIHVNAQNHGFSAIDYIESIPIDLVGEIHLAGHTVQAYDGHEILVDTHNALVCDEVWMLYDAAIVRYGPIPTLIEWDSELPPVETLLAEAARAQQSLARYDEYAA
ncbi:DUF692 domain-containing protein [Candidatus Rariloculus sp.]|uniref:MNIO family bufferin maturase n=1 Tax=Candidatus Rariloculus sp. TaxID=3101265 RepID=UPI003D11D2B0